MKPSTRLSPRGREGDGLTPGEENGLGLGFGSPDSSAALGMTSADVGMTAEVGLVRQSPALLATAPKSCTTRYVSPETASPGLLPVEVSRLNHSVLDDIAAGAGGL